MFVEKTITCDNPFMYSVMMGRLQNVSFKRYNEDGF